MKRISIIISNEEEHLSLHMSDIFKRLVDTRALCERVLLAYNKCDLYYLLSVVADGDPLTNETQLSKNEFLNGITTCIKFIEFTNGNLSAGYDVLSATNNIIYADSRSTTVIKQIYETLGHLLVDISKSIIDIYIYSSEALKIARDNNLSSCLALSGEDFINARLTLEDFLLFCEGNAPQDDFYKYMLKAHNKLRTGRVE